MSLANKKVNQSKSSAQQNAQILAQVKSLLEKNLIKFENDEVLLYQQIWKDKASALNWIKCVHIYCVLKRGFKTTDPLTFKNIENQEIIGTFINKTAKLLINL